MSQKKRQSLDGKSAQYAIKDYTKSKNGDKFFTISLPQRVLSGIKDAIICLVKDSNALQCTNLSASWSTKCSNSIETVAFTFYNRNGKQGRWKQFEIELLCNAGVFHLSGKHLEHFSEAVLP